MKPKVYIDGKEGTTGLQIYERLGSRSDIDLLLIDEDKRKDLEERRRLINAADIVFLCLPDAAAIEAALNNGDDVTGGAVTLELEGEFFSVALEHGAHHECGGHQATKCRRDNGAGIMACTCLFGEVTGGGGEGTDAVIGCRGADKIITHWS